MKKIKMLTFAAGMITLMASLPAMAQQLKVTFTMSSSFYASSAKLPPGTYILRQMQDDPNAYTLQNSSGTHTVLLGGRPSSQTSPGKPEIRLNKYDGVDYLEGVQTSTGNSIDIDTGLPEKLAAKKGAPETHTVPTK